MWQEEGGRVREAEHALAIAGVRGRREEMAAPLCSFSRKTYIPRCRGIMELLLGWASSFFSTLFFFFFFFFLFFLLHAVMLLFSSMV
jgi:hypothetical protein